MILSQIAAISENFALGKNNKLLWNYPEDMKFFVDKTKTKIMIMGRKTFESFGKPLPKRFHIVISRQSEKSDSSQVLYVPDVATAINEAQRLVATKAFPEEVMILGGAEIYKQTLDVCDFLYLTRIPGTYEADTFYPSHFDTVFGIVATQKGEAPPHLQYEVWSKRQTLSQK